MVSQQHHSNKPAAAKVYKYTCALLMLCKCTWLPLIVSALYASVCVGFFSRH